MSVVVLRLVRVRKRSRRHSWLQQMDRIISAIDVKSILDIST